MGGLRGFGREMWRQVARRPRHDARAAGRQHGHAPPQRRRARRNDRGSARWSCRASAIARRCCRYSTPTAKRLTLNAELGGVAVGEHEPPVAEPTARACPTCSASAWAPATSCRPAWAASLNSPTARPTACGSITTTSAPSSIAPSKSWRASLVPPQPSPRRRVCCCRRPHETVSLSRSGHSRLQPISGMASVVRGSICQRSDNFCGDHRCDQGQSASPALMCCAGFAAAAVMLHHHGQYYDELYPGRIPLSFDLARCTSGSSCSSSSAGFVILMTIERKQTVRSLPSARARRLMPAFLAALVMADRDSHLVARCPCWTSPTVPQFLANLTMAPEPVRPGAHGHAVLDADLRAGVLHRHGADPGARHAAPDRVVRPAGRRRGAACSSRPWMSGRTIAASILLLVYYSNFFLIGICLYRIHAPPLLLSAYGTAGHVGGPGRGHRRHSAGRR